MLGDRVNVYPVKGYSITVTLDSKQSKKSALYVTLLEEAAEIVTSRLGENRFWVAGTEVSIFVVRIISGGLGELVGPRVDDWMPINVVNPGHDALPELVF